MIELPEGLVFDMLSLIDEHVGRLQDMGEPGVAEEWESDANLIRDALGIENDERGLRNMSNLTDGILNKISTTSEALEVISRIMSEFNMVGAVFTRDDVRDEVVEYVYSNPYSELDSGDIDVLVNECLSTGDFEVVTDYLTQAGNEAIAEGVAERMRELGV